MTAVLTKPKTRVLIEEHIILRGVSWRIYEALMKEHESRSAPRFTFNQGCLEIYMPSQKHEEKAEFLVPSNDKMLKVDELKGKDGKNHIVVLFTKKQLPIEKLVDEMNEIKEEMDIVQRIYTVIGFDLIPAKNLTYDKVGIKVSGVATDQQIMPVIIEYVQD